MSRVALVPERGPPTGGPGNERGPPHGSRHPLLHVHPPEWESTLTDRFTETAQIADQGGVSLLTVMDHWFQMLHTGGPFEPMLEGYTSLGYLAGVTKNVRLSLLVTGVTYRHPGLLAKTVSTLDVLSRGRAIERCD